MTVYSIIVLKKGASPPDVSRGEIINVEAPWDLVEGLAQLSLARYPGADEVIAVDEMGHTCGRWRAESPSENRAPSAASDRRKGKISDAFGILHRDGGPILTIEEINEATSKGWAG